MGAVPEITVIMLTYNREELAPRAIDSVLRQTFCDFEFIIVDNGSTDRSGAIADEYAAKDVRVKVIHKERGNIGSGRNAGLGAAIGNYVTFIDDDDWAEPDFLDFLHSLATDNNADIAICGSWRQLENGEIEPKYIFDGLYVYGAETAVKEMILRARYNSATPTKLFKKHLFEHIRFPLRGRHDDISTTYKLFANAVRTVVQGKGKYYFSRHGDNNSIASTKHQHIDSAQLDEYLAVFRERTAYLHGLLPELANFARWSEWSYMISMVEKIERHHIKDCAETLGHMLSELKQNRDAFIQSEWTQDFERQWMDRYV